MNDGNDISVWVRLGHPKNWIVRSLKIEVSIWVLETVCLMVMQELQVFS